MSVVSPVSQRTTVVGLLLLTFSTGLVDAISVLVLGHVFVANMTGNVIFLGFWFAPRTVVDMTAALVAFVSFVTGAILGGRLSRHLDGDVRRWLTVALGIEVGTLATLSILSGTGANWGAICSSTSRPMSPVSTTDTSRHRISITIESSFLTR